MAIWFRIDRRRGRRRLNSSSPRSCRCVQRRPRPPAWNVFPKITHLSCMPLQLPMTLLTLSPPVNAAARTPPTQAPQPTASPLLRAPPSSTRPNRSRQCSPLSSQSLANRPRSNEPEASVTISSIHINPRTHSSSSLKLPIRTMCPIPARRPAWALLLRVAVLARDGSGQALSLVTSFRGSTTFATPRTPQRCTVI